MHMKLCGVYTARKSYTNNVKYCRVYVLENLILPLTCMHDHEFSCMLFYIGIITFLFLCLKSSKRVLGLWPNAEYFRVVHGAAAPDYCVRNKKGDKGDGHSLPLWTHNNVSHLGCCWIKRCKATCCHSTGTEMCTNVEGLHACLHYVNAYISASMLLLFFFIYIYTRLPREMDFDYDCKTFQLLNHRQLFHKGLFHLSLQGNMGCTPTFWVQGKLHSSFLFTSKITLD